MSQNQDTKCVMCGSIRKICEVCNKPFYSTRRNHHICSTRCRTRKSRNKKALKQGP